MPLLESLSPQQRQILMYGAPVVGVFALMSALGKNQEADTPAAVTGTTGYTMPSTDAIGTGQLSDFESLVTARLQTLGATVEQNRLLSLIPPANPAPPAPPSAPADDGPAWTPSPAPPPVCPAPPSGWPSAPGEMIIKRLDAPGGGCWWFSNLGGVANMGGAPFLGSASGYRMGPGFESPPRYIVDVVPSGRGYRMISNYAGQTYDFPA